MKPLHIALLAIGATLAGALAFKMTQLTPFEMASAAPAAPAPPPVPAPAPVIAPAVQEPAKPSPIPNASAPPAIYSDYVASTPTPTRDQATTKKRTQYPSTYPATARKQPLLQVARTKPLQWTSVPYQQPPRNFAGAAATSPIASLPQPPVESSPVASLSISEPAAVAEPQRAALQRPAPRSVTLTTGMTILIRLSEPLTADRAAAGDRFRATLAEPVVVNGLVIAERGAHVSGRIVDTQKPGWFNSKSLLELELSNLSTSDGQDVPISTDPWTDQADRLVSLSTNTIIRFHLASQVTVTERQL